MRFSVLLPTRNGGAFLGDALDSVLGQAGDFEIVVADNANSDGTDAILLARRGDSRLRVLRSESVVTVTENWMRSLRAARGDYMLMIGDDDLLLPGFFDRMSALLDRHDQPDCVTFDAYSYVAPGSFGADVAAMWSPRHFDMRRLGPERELPLSERLTIVRDMFRFRVRFPLNMQLTLFSRTALGALPGDLFRAPFPDHFAINSLLLRADRTVVSAERQLVVGVSPKSFGHFFYGGQQALGVRYLGSGSDFPGRLEGSELLNSMYAWLLLLRNSYPELARAQVNRWAYVVRQANYWLRELEFGAMPLPVLMDRLRSLGLLDLVTALPPVLLYRCVAILRDLSRHRHRTFIGEAWPALRPTAQPTIVEFAATLPPAGA